MSFRRLRETGARSTPISTPISTPFSDAAWPLLAKCPFQRRIIASCFRDRFPPVDVALTMVREHCRVRRRSDGNKLLSEIPSTAIRDDFTGERTDTLRSFHRFVCSGSLFVDELFREIIKKKDDSRSAQCRRSINPAALDLPVLFGALFEEDAIA